MDGDITHNRKALHDFHVMERYEAGIELKGTEVKSIRDGLSNLNNAFARVEGGQVFVYDLDIQPYARASFEQHLPKAPRRLLLNRKEIDRISTQTQIKGHTLVALRMYWKNSRVKVELGVARGKDHRDQRADLKERVTKREMDRERLTFNRRNV
ncbi:MAG: SsrA-binding protein SmpB [Verrucomicrobiota bacterium]